MLALVFLLLLAVGGARAGFAHVLPLVVGAVGGAGAVEFWVDGRTGRGWRWPSSAWLSGLIVAFVLGAATYHGVAAAIGALVAVGCVVGQLVGAGQAYLLLGLLLGNVALACRRWVHRPARRGAPRKLVPASE